MNACCPNLTYAQSENLIQSFLGYFICGCWPFLYHIPAWRHISTFDVTGQAPSRLSIVHTMQTINNKTPRGKIFVLCVHTAEDKIQVIWTVIWTDIVHIDVYWSYFPSRYSTSLNYGRLAHTGFGKITLLNTDSFSSVDFSHYSPYEVNGRIPPGFSQSKIS